MKYITITNFKKYQHYSNREIHWVKMYLNMLTDYKIRTLSPTSRWIFVGIILLTATKQGQCEYDLDYIKEMLCGGHTKRKQLELAINELERLALIKIVASLDKIREDKIRKEKSTASKQDLIDKYKSKYKNLDLEEEWDKFIAYNAEVREKPLKSISLGWINWLKNAEKFHLTSPEGIRERELEQERKKGEELKNKKGSPMPESLRKQRDDLLKKVSR